MYICECVCDFSHFKCKLKLRLAAVNGATASISPKNLRHSVSDIQKHVSICYVSKQQLKMKILHFWDQDFLMLCLDRLFGPKHRGAQRRSNALRAPARWWGARPGASCCGPLSLSNSIQGVHSCKLPKPKPFEKKDEVGLKLWNPEGFQMSSGIPV